MPRRGRPWNVCHLKKNSFAGKNLTLDWVDFPKKNANEYDNTIGTKSKFDELSIGGISIAYKLTSPVGTKILCFTDGVNGIKPKHK